MEDNIVSNCYGGQMGGIAYCSSVGLTVMNNDFINCTAWNSGGGFRMSQNSGGRTRL